jgi:hypothetical protein
VTLLEWVAAIAVVLGSVAVLWAVKTFDDVVFARPRPRAVPRRRRDAAADRKAA